MEAVFVKENILKSKENDKTGKNALKLLKVEPQNEFLHGKNASQCVDLLKFLTCRDDVFILTGYPLCGKTLITSLLPQILLEKTVLHFFKCNKSSTIDDLLLTFFETFKIYAQKRLIRIPKIETQNFQERINIYLTKCDNPIVIVLDGLNEITDAKNKEAIMNFLSQVVSMEKIKLIITTRAFDVADLKNINLRVSNSLIKPLTLEDLKNYCLKNVINSNEIEEFHSLTRGHYLNLSLTMNYIQPTNLSIAEFVKEVKEAKKSVDEILISKNLSLVPPQCSHLLWVVALADFGMPKSSLVNLPDIDDEQFSILEKKGIIEIFNDCVYLKDYFKTEILKAIEPLAQINIVKGIIKFLEAQLPLKPSVREVKLSRVTIRNEIERLNKIINKTKIVKDDKNKSAYLNILGYAKQFKTNWDGFDDIIMPKNTFKDVIDKSAEKVEEQAKPNEVQEVEKKTSSNSILELARMLKNKYAFGEALVQYADAISAALETNNTKELLDMLKEIAECYFKIGDYENAIENYGKAHEIAKNDNLTYECYSILLSMAEIYKINYKKDLACEIYRDILSQQDLPESLTLEAELNLFEVNFSAMTPKEIISKYLELLEKSKNVKECTAKIYFRLGFLYDKASGITKAEIYYKKSIETCDDYKVNTNLSSCYYNLAEICSDRKDYDSALDYYLKSYSIDEITKNLDGQIITMKKIAQIYEKMKNPLALDYYEKALEYAKKLDDNYPLACSYIDLGDYYYRQKEDVSALKVYMSAQKTLVNQLTLENELAIKDRINDLKVRMGKDVVDKIIKEFYS